VPKKVNGNDAILDRSSVPAAGADVPSATSPASRRGPWLQLGTIDRFEWNRYELPVSALPPALDGLRILHLTDIHLKSAWHPALDGLLQRVQHDPPDLIFITGDFVEDKYDGPRAAVPLMERFVRGLRSRSGIYAILGNHDGDFIAPRLPRWGVEFLPVGAQTIHVRGAAVELIGLAGVGRQDLELQDVLDLAPRNRATPGVPRIALSHYPDALVSLQKFDVIPDLFFAGHTHGGQVCLPGGFPILRHDTLPRRYCSGVHRFGDTWLIVSRGLGFSSYAIRVFCAAEVVEVVLRAGQERTGGNVKTH
jgi:uncharacterized protein